MMNTGHSFDIGSHPLPTATGEDDARITEQVEREMQARGSSPISVIAFGLVLTLCVGVFALTLRRTRSLAPASSVEATRSLEIASPAPRPVEWTYSPEDAQSRAANEHKKILIDFYTDWCSDCRWMDTYVYPRPEVAREAQNFVMLKVNAEGRADLAKRYNIRMYPTLVWTDATGNELTRHDGSAPVPELTALMMQNH